MAGDNRKRMTARRVKIEDIINGDYHQQEGFEPNFIITPRGMRVSRASIVGTVVDTYQNDDRTYGAITLDDGSETIRAKLFQELEDMDEVEEGDIIEIVGKVREYEDETYIQPEIIAQREIKGELLHALETEQLQRKWKKAVEKAQQMQDANRAEDDIRQELKGMGVDGDDVDAILEYLSADAQFETAEKVDGGTGSQQQTESTGEAPMMDEDEDQADENAKQLILGIIEELDDGDGAEYSDIIDQADMSEDRVESVINDLLSDGTCYEPKPGRMKKL